VSADDAIWDLLREHADAGNEARDRDAAWGAARRDASVRLLDAAVGVVGSTRQFLAVVEDVLREQRDRVAAGAPDRGDGVGVTGDPSDEKGRQRIELSY
jgi:hypothetical protein